MPSTDTVSPQSPGAADTDTDRRRDRLPQILAVLALAGFAAAAFLVISLDLSSGEYAARQTVSAYVFTHPVEFTSAVLLLVAGSAALTMALARRGTLGIAAGVLLSVWALGLTAVAVFPKHNWAEGPSMSGHIHRVASLVAFFALPIAIAVLTAKAWRKGGAISARVGSVFGLGAALVLGYLVWSVLQSKFTGVPWWQAVELGLVERVLIGFEVAALAAVAVWSIRRPASRTAPAVATP